MNQSKESLAQLEQAYIELGQKIKAFKEPQFEYPLFMKDKFNGNKTCECQKPKFKLGDYAVVDGKIIPVRDTNLMKFNKEKYMAPMGTNIKLWTLEEASDDDWVMCSDGLIGYLKTVKSLRSGHSWNWVKPYIGQSPKQLGLEK